MVLDPKSGGSHNDYGSFSGEGEGEGEGSAPVTAAAAGVVTGGGGGPVMAQSDLYQRQPLLTSDTPCQDDEDDKMDGLKRNTINSNGVVRIDVVPPLQREEPRYPKEKMKTFIGNHYNCFMLTISVTLLMSCTFEI